MYGLPKGFDGSQLIGRSLEQICFSQNQVTLHFDEKLTIVIESALSYRDAAGATDRVIEIPVSQSDLMYLLGYPILKAFGDDNGTLTMEFENGRILKCLDTSQEYESYRIIHNNEEVIV